MNSSSSGSASRSATPLAPARGLARTERRTAHGGCRPAQPEDTASSPSARRPRPGSPRPGRMSPPRSRCAGSRGRAANWSTVSGSTSDHLRLRVRVEVRARLVEELAGQRHPLGIDVVDDREDRRRSARRPRSRSRARTGSRPGGRAIDSSGTESSLTAAGPRRPRRLVEHPSTENATDDEARRARTSAGQLRGAARSARPPRRTPEMPLRPLEIGRLRLTATRVATPFTCTARAIVGGLNPTAIAPFASRFARVREPSGADTHSVTTGRPRHLRPPPACERRPEVFVTRGDPHGDPAVDELDHIGFEHGRHLRPAHEEEPTPATTRRLARDSFANARLAYASSSCDAGSGRGRRVRSGCRAGGRACAGSP